MKAKFTNTCKGCFVNKKVFAASSVEHARKASNAIGKKPSGFETEEWCKPL